MPDPLKTSALRLDARALASKCHQGIDTIDIRDADGTYDSVVARCDTRTLSRDWDAELDHAGNHAAAAIALAHSLGWLDGSVISGMGSTQDGYVFTLAMKARS